MFSLPIIISFLSHYGYALLIPLAIIEGPVVTIIAAFMASMGVFNIFLVYLIAVMGDVVGDSLYYWLGRLGRRTFVLKYGARVGLTEARIQYAETNYNKHLWKVMIIGKIAQAPVILAIIAAGAAKINFKRFLMVVTVTTLIKAFVLVLIGYYFGKSYNLISHYFNNYVIGVWALLVFAIAGYFIYKKLMPKINS